MFFMVSNLQIVAQSGNSQIAQHNLQIFANSQKRGTNLSLGRGCVDCVRIQFRVVDLC